MKMAVEEVMLSYNFLLIYITVYAILLSKRKRFSKNGSFYDYVNNGESRYYFLKYFLFENILKYFFIF
jgi:hypothetical protein